MALITEKKLSTIVDLPVSLPALELKQGDWLVVASFKLESPQRITYDFLTLELIKANVALSSVSASNKVVSNLDLAFIGLYRDYTSGFPGLTPALDVVSANAVGAFGRSGATLTYATPGVYSFIIANNMQADSSSAIPVATSIDFTICATGSVRLELDSS